MSKFIIAFAIALVACGKNAPTDTIRQTIAEARTKPEVQIQIRLLENELPNPDALALRRRLEDQIEQQHVGTVVSDGSDVGHMDIRVQVDNTVSAIPRIQKILDTNGVLSRSSVKVAEAR